jgi:hypothetical protein
MNRNFTPDRSRRSAAPHGREVGSNNCRVRWALIFAILFLALGIATDPSWSQEVRTWTDASGKFSVEATLKEVKRESVVLILADGTEKTVPLAQLSEADRQFTAEYRKAMLAENAAKRKAAADAKLNADDLKAEMKAILADLVQREEQLKATESDPARFRTARQPLVQDTSAKLLNLVQDVPQSEVAQDAYVWILRNGGQGAESNLALKLMVQHFPDTPELVPLMSLIARDLPVLEQLLAKTKDKTVKGNAAFMLASRLASSNNPAPEEKVVQLFTQVIDKYADVGDAAQNPLGPQAKRQLFVVQNLSVGKVAPDIYGADLDGVAFKLSDYRGKVVVLDFWGDW